MADYTGKNIKDTYESILNLGVCGGADNQQLDPNNCIVVTDGRGTSSALFLGSCTCQTKVCGSLCVSSSITTGATFCAPSIIQTNTGATVKIKGDLFVNAGSSKEFSVDNSTGLTFIKGKANVGLGFATSDQTLTNKCEPHQAIN